MRKYGLAAGIIIVILVIIASLLPVSQSRILSYGIDSYDTHRPITNKNILGQTVSLEGQLVSIAAIIVPLNHQHKTTDVTVQIIDTKNQILTQTVIPASAIQDDTFSKATFSGLVGQAGQLITILFSTPNNTDPTLAALRYDPNPLTRLEAGRVKPGTYAIELYEKVPVWQAIYTTFATHQNKIGPIMLVIAIALLVSLLASHKKLKIAALILLAIVALSSRLFVLNQLGGVSGGDAYNYLEITKSISHLHNPFANTKRLPFYPLLLVPSFVSHQGDPIRTMIIIQTLSAVGILLLLPTLATRLKLPWGIGFIAATLLAGQKDFFATSIRPEPYTIFALLVLLAVISYLKRDKPWQQYAFSIILGCAAMTRQEGFLLAALFGVIEIIQQTANIIKSHQFKLQITAAANSFLPALLIVIPFFLHNYISFGNPIFTPYFEGDRLQIVNSFPAFLDSLGATWGVLGSIYKPAWDELVRIDFTSPLFLSSLAIVLLWSCLYIFRRQLHKFSPYILPIIAIPLAAGSVYAFVLPGGLFSSLITTFAAAVVLASFIAFLWQTKWRGIIVLAIFFTQAGIALWFHPFAKHFQQSLPLLFIIIAAWLASPALNPEFLTTKIRHIISPLIIACLLTPFFLSSSILWQNVGLMIDKQNINNALDSVLYRAIKVARLQSDPVGVNEDLQPVRTFYDDTAGYFRDDKIPTTDQAQQWLQANHIKTMIVTTNSQAFKIMPAGWNTIAHFKSEGDDNRLYESFVYQVP